MRDRIREAMARAFDNLEPDQIPIDASIDSLPAWDSLGHLMLMLEVESEFDQKIPSDVMMELTSVDAIETYLRGAGVA